VIGKNTNQKGFSLLELMIVMFIMIILISVALPAYNGTVRHAEETVLKDDLVQMRKLIDQYTADKGKLPANLDALVESKYLREIPVDPVFKEAKWDEKLGEDPNDQDSAQGLIDVKSFAEGQDSSGVEFSTY
jgi:general secretion pathway protein G